MLDHVFTDAIGALRDSLERAFLERQAFEERFQVDVLLGDATLFPQAAEVEASWRVVDPLEEFWLGQEPALYRAGEWGPKEADEMLARGGRVWRRP